jgi:hypothetical protein
VNFRGEQTSSQNSTFYIVFAAKWPQWNFRRVNNCTDSESFVLGDKFHHVIQIFVFSAHWWISQAFLSLTEVTPSFEFEKLRKNLSPPPPGLLTKSYFQYFGSFCSIFPRLKQNLLWTWCSSNSDIIFYIHQKCQRYTHFLFHRALLNNQGCCSLISSRKWLNKLYPNYIKFQKFVLAATVSSNC